MAETERKFAYGLDTFCGCQCPAEVAGRRTSAAGPFPDVIYEYDMILNEEHGTWKGVVSEEDAKDTWFQAIEEFESAAGNEPAEYQRETALDIAEELGWERDD
jgi:hypothetical protein